MASNTFNNMVKIAKDSMDCIENQLSLAKMVNRRYEDMFKDGSARQGDTINTRVPALGYQVGEGSAVSPQGYVDTYVPVQLKQYHAAMQFTTKELLLNVEDNESFKQNVLNPLVAPVANKIDQILWSLVPGISNAVGVPGTKLTNSDLLLDAGALLDESGVPRDGNWAAILSPRHAAGILKGTTQYFNPQADIAAQYRDGQLGRMLGGFRTSVDANALTHTVGTFGTSTPLVDVAPTSGAVQVVTKGWASNASALKVGDKIAFAGCYAVNPVSKLSTGELKSVTVIEDCDDTSGAMTIKFSPALVTSGPNQNVDAMPVGDAAIYVWGTNNNASSGKVGNISLLMHPDAMTLCAVDMPKPTSAVYCVRVRSPRLNVPIRLVQFYNGSTDVELFRLDTLVGGALTRGNFAVKMVG